MPFRRSQKRTLLIACLIVATIYILQPYTHFKNFYYYMYQRDSIQCYRAKSAALPDISDTQPAKGKSIFFHETSCNSHLNGKISITARQACAVESAARLNPDYEVHLLFASPGSFQFEATESDRFLQGLLEYSNVKIHHVDYERYTRGTPVEKLYETGKIEASWYPQSHASDVLRYLTLWKYGGIYLDLDVVVIKPLSLPTNYAGAQSDEEVAAGVLSFASDGPGHDLAQHCLNDLGENFKGSEWASNGPGVITRLLQKVCQVESAREMVDMNCGGFRVFPKEAFYPIPWQDWKMYFDEGSAQEVLNISRNSYAIHVWNKLSALTKVPINGNSAYALFAQKFCPNVANECEFLF